MTNDERRTDGGSRRDQDEPQSNDEPRVDDLGGVTIEGFDEPAETGSVNDGWWDLPDGAEPFTPDEMIPDRTFMISEFLPGDGDTRPRYSTEAEDPDSPKARERRRLVEQNSHIYNNPPDDL
jgi:hypothetical protein